MAYTKFPLFQSHLDLAHSYWERIVRKGDSVIDATCGNGHDTLKLAQQALTENEGRLWGLDIQEQAIINTAALLKKSLPPEAAKRATLLQSSHEQFPKDIERGSVKLIVYNLGYLPGGDKSLTTSAKGTLASLREAQEIIAPGGAISITCYPGHPEGAREEELLIEHISTWAPQVWNCTFHRWLNRRQAPSLLFLQKQ